MISVETDARGLSTHSFETRLLRNRLSDIYPAIMGTEITATNTFFFFFLTDKRDALHCWWHLTEFSTSYSRSFYPISRHILNPDENSLFIHFYAVVTKQLIVVEWQYRGLFLTGWPSLLTGDKSAIVFSIMSPRPSTSLVEISKEKDKESTYTCFICTHTLRFMCTYTCVYICTVKGKLGDADTFEWISLHLPGTAASHSSSWSDI